jgi:hypothetical protein
MSGVEQLAASNRSAKMTRTRWFIVAFPTTKEISMGRNLGVLWLSRVSWWTFDIWSGGFFVLKRLPIG